MNSCLEAWSEHIRPGSKEKPKATHGKLQYEQDKSIIKDNVLKVGKIIHLN